jgi:hypothetical protein
LRRVSTTTNRTTQSHASGRPVAACPALVWRLTRSVHSCPFTRARPAPAIDIVSHVLSRCAAAGPEPRCPERFSHGSRPPVYTGRPPHRAVPSARKSTARAVPSARTSTTPVPLGCSCLSYLPMYLSAKVHAKQSVPYRQRACNRCTYPPRSACEAERTYRQSACNQCTT